MWNSSFTYPSRDNMVNCSADLLSDFSPLCGSHLFPEDCAQGTGPCPLVCCYSVPLGFRTGWNTPSSSKATLLIFSPLLPSSCLLSSLPQHL